MIRAEIAPAIQYLEQTRFTGKLAYAMARGLIELKTRHRAVQELQESAYTEASKAYIRQRQELALHWAEKGDDGAPLIERGMVRLRPGYDAALRELEAAESGAHAQYLVEERALADAMREEVALPRRTLSMGDLPEEFSGYEGALFLDLLDIQEG